LEECNICGAKDAQRKARIEGVILVVCDNCVKLGEEITIIKIKQVKKTPKIIEESQDVVVHYFFKIIKTEREKRNMTQEELARKLNEKLSVIRRIEEGWEPPISLIKKLEKFFKIDLIEKVEKKKINKRQEQRKLTIGDIVEVN